MVKKKVIKKIEASIPDVVKKPKKEVTKEPKKVKKVYPEMEIVIDSEGRKIEGFVLVDGKSVMDVAGVTFAL